MHGKNMKTYSIIPWHNNYICGWRHPAGYTSHHN